MPIPHIDDGFDVEEGYASRGQPSQSKPRTRRLDEISACHDDNQIAREMKKVMCEAGDVDGSFVQEAAQQIVKTAEW